jgi:hypothetical protein
MTRLLRFVRYATAVLSFHVVGIVLACATGEWWWALMPIPIFGQVPSSLTDDYGALLTTTLRAMQPRLHDNITRGNKFIAWLEMRGRWRKQDGGERVKVALMHAQNSTADIYSGYGLLDTTPQDGITSAFYEWAQLAVSISISRKEERQNSGQSRAIPLLRSKTEQAEASIRELLNNCIVAGRITASAASGRFLARIGRLDSGASGPLPLAALVDANASRSVSIGNINGNTYSFWRNQADSSTATTFAGYKQELNNLYNDCSKGVGGPPDLFMGDQVAWEQYWNSLQNQERYVITDPRVVNVLGGADAIKFRNAAFIWDEVVPDVETNAEVVDAIGTVTVSNVHMLNSETFEWVVDSETDFITTPFVRPQDQDARVGQILWMGALGVNNRRKNGVLYGISRSIVS